MPKLKKIHGVTFELWLTSFRVNDNGLVGPMHTVSDTLDVEEEARAVAKVIRLVVGRQYARDRAAVINLAEPNFKE